MTPNDRAILTSTLRSNRVYIEYAKVDGEIANLIGTMRSDLLPSCKVFEKHDPDTGEKKERKESNPELLLVYNKAKEGFRSIKYDNIRSYRIIEDTEEL